MAPAGAGVHADPRTVNGVASLWISGGAPTRSSPRTLSLPPAARERKRLIQVGLRSYPQVWRTLWIRRVALGTPTALCVPFGPSPSSRLARDPLKMWINRSVAHRLPTARWGRETGVDQAWTVAEALLGHGPYGIVGLLCAGGILSEAHVPTQKAAAPPGARVSGPHAHTGRTPHAPASSGEGEASADRLRLGPDAAHASARSARAGRRVPPCVS